VVVSTLEEIRSFAAKPSKRIALVGVPKKTGAGLKSLGDVEHVKTLAELGERSGPERPDCVVVQVNGGKAQSLIDELKASPMAHSVLFLQGDMSADEERLLRLSVFDGLARLARNPDQLFEECSLVLHEKVDKLPEAVRAHIAQRREDQYLTGRKIVVIDDDIRNIFSLASALEDYGVELRYAESGRGGLELLQREPDAEVVLVDIMMPDMDGYETIQRIREMPGNADLPIVAVTAKAMKGDRQKCIQAGASDYVAKPVDIDHLVSVLRVALQRTEQSRSAVETLAVLTPAG